MSNKHIDIVVPCFNEEECIPLFFDEVSQVFSNIDMTDFTIIFVDDGSRDNTLNTIRNLAQTHGAERVKYISFSRNFGKESAIYAGLNATKSELVVLMDADLQHPPALLPMMIHVIEEGYDSCAMYRSNRQGEPALRSLFSRWFYSFFDSISSVKMKPSSTDFRLMTRQMVDSVLSLGETERFTKGLFQWVGFKTKWIDSKNVERASGESKFSFFSLFRYAINGIVAFSTVPLRFASIIGFLVIIAAFSYMVVVIIRVLIFGSSAPGFATIVVLMLFLGGIIISLLGIIGEYISRIYQEVKRRPIFIAKETNITNEEVDYVRR